MHQFQKLEVYQFALVLTRQVHRVARTFPRDELFGLTSQFKRAAYSIVLNIAEGAGRRTNKDFARYLDQAIGSTYECIACIEVARINEFFKPEEHELLYKKLDQIAAMLTGLQRSFVRDP